MKKRVSLAVGAALVSGALVACWYTGHRFDRIMAEQISQVGIDSGLTLQWLPSGSNLFTRDGVLKLMITPQELAALDSELANTPPLELQFMVKSRILPLHIKSHVLLETRQGSLAPVFTALGMERWRLGLESVSSLWSMSNSSRFWSDEFRVKQGGDELHFLPLTGEYHGDFAGRGQLAFDWQGMTLHAGQSQLDVALAGMKGSAELAPLSGVWLSLQSQMSVTALSMQLPDSVKIAVQGVTTETQLKEDDLQSLSTRYEIKIDKLDLENEADTLSITDSKLALNLNGLDLEAYQALQALSSQGMAEEATWQALDKLLGRGAMLELTELSARLNGEPVVCKGAVTLAATSLDKLFNSEAGMQALTGYLNATLSDKLGQAVPQLAPMLEQLTASGYLTVDQHTLRSDLKLDKGALTINKLAL